MTQPLPPCLPYRPLIKLHLLWKKDGVLVSGGISDYNRRLTITNPSSRDAGYYECEAVLRSSSVAPVVRGAYLSVLGEAGCTGWGPPLENPTAPLHAPQGSDHPPPRALLPTEPPQFTKEPERHITAEMEKVVDIPCRAKGNITKWAEGVTDRKQSQMACRVWGTSSTWSPPAGSGPPDLRAWLLLLNHHLGHCT